MISPESFPSELFLPVDILLISSALLFSAPFALVAWLDTCAKDTDTVGGKQGTEAFGPCLCSLGSNLLKGEPRYPLEAQPSF